MSDRFYDDLPLVSHFDALSRPDGYVPLPEDWLVGVSDVADSTGAIAAGAYKTVNMIGAAVISAQINAHAPKVFPYVFGGDGASFAIPPGRADAAKAALQAVMAWATDAYDLTLRGALVPVSDVRSAGMDVRITRYRASKAVDYAMFSGGGLAWAESQLKGGRIGLDPAPPKTEPDLAGLSCRWSNMKARNGKIVSVIILPATGADDAGFAACCENILAMTEQLDRNGHPVPSTGPAIRWPGKGIRIEMAAPGRRLSAVVLENLAFWLSLKTGLKPAGFDGRAYAQEVTDNADFRKFDDGLKMTLDCDAKTLARLKEMLSESETAGIVRYGLSEQDEAMMTCVVPSAFQDDHVHFIDGAAGGYTQAAAQMKRHG